MSHLQVLSRLRWGVLAILLAVSVALYTALRWAGFYGLMEKEVEGINTLILLVGSIYAVLLAFTIFVVWGQFNETENLVIQESNSLDDLLEFSEFFRSGYLDIKTAVRNYIGYALASEWSSLSEGNICLRTEASFKTLMNAVVVKVNPSNEKEQQVYKQLLNILQRMSEKRDERVAKSLTRIPQTLVTLVTTMATAIVFLVFLYPAHNPVAGFCFFVITMFLVFLANHVVMDTDNPLEGTWNVSQRPFKTVYEKTR